MPRPAKILVVDDQQLVRDTLLSLLRQQPHWTVYEAENGKDALDRARQIKPDVVVMDIVMPEMSGIEATYEIRRQAPETKVILMSSYYTTQEAAHLARLFGDGNFIEKPETGKRLIPTIDRILPPECQELRYEQAENLARLMPSSWALDDFGPYLEHWGCAVWIEAAWIEIDREKIASQFVLGPNLRAKSDAAEAYKHRLMPYIEGAHLGYLPVSAFKRAFRVGNEDTQFHPLTW